MEEGDLIAIDIPAHTITLKVDEATLAARKAKWVCPRAQDQDWLPGPVCQAGLLCG